MHSTVQKLFLLLGFCWATKSQSQSITLSVDRQPLQQVFRLIEQQSTYHFTYTRELLVAAKPVTIHVSGVSLTAALDACFEGQPLTYSLNDHDVIVQARAAPAVTGLPLDGFVVDASGQPLAGVTIAVKGSSFVTVTDASGRFHFDALPATAVLVLSGAELEGQEVAIGSRRTLTVTLSRKIGILDETMVIAYGKVSRRLSTGSVTSVKGSDLLKQPSNDPLLSLEGRVPGLQVLQNSGMPGASVTLQLRGLNSLANGNDPLYIIDGVPYPSTTLSGSFGGAGGISASPFTALNPSDIESIDVLKDADATAIYGSRGANGVILITTKKGKPGPAHLSLHYYEGAGAITRKMDLLNTPAYIAMRREAFRNDGIAPTASTAKDLLVWDTTRYTDWQEALIGNTSHIHDATLNYSGGDALTQFLVSGAYRRETTVFPGDYDLNKWSGLFSLTRHSSDGRFLLSISANYHHLLNHLPIQDLSSQITQAPNTPAPFNADGSINWSNSTWNNNPYGLVEQHFNYTQDNFVSHLSLQYRLTKGLVARVTGGFTNVDVTEHVVTPSTASNPLNTPLTNAKFGHSHLRTLILEPQIEYTLRHSLFSVTTLLGSTLQSNSSNALYQTGSGYTSDALLNSLKAAATVTTTGESAIDYRYSGIFARLTADWAQTYLLTLTARRDGSSRFGPEHRFSNFGSAGAGWIFSSLKGLKRWKWLSFGKLRGSIGITGNDQIGDYRYLDLYGPDSYSYLSVTPFSPQQLYNPDYGWEKVRKTEAAVELGFLQNRFYLTTSYYRNLTTNQLVTYPLPVLTGFDGVLQNIPANILNTGWEFDLNATIIQHGTFSWTARANLSIPTNRLLSYDGLSSSSYANQYVVGRSLFIRKLYHFTGVDPTRGIYTFEDVNHDNRISAPADAQTIVFTGQQYYGALENVLTYKRISLSFLWQFVRQQAGLNYLGKFSVRPGALGNQPTLVLARWQQPGDIAELQRFTQSSADYTTAATNFRSSDALYSDASYVRLKNVYLTIDLLSPRLRKAGLSEAKLVLQAQNLFTFTPYLGLDPETQSYLPPLRMITGGLQFTF